MRKIKQFQKLKSLLLILIVFVCAFLSLYDLGSRSVEKWDEETNIQVVQSTVNSNSFPILKNKEKAFLEKPPLWYYLTILITKVFGNNLVSFRIISAVSNTFLLILIILFCKRYLSSNITIFSGLTYLSTWQVFINNPNNVFSTHFARSADLDFLQLLFIFGTIFAIVEFHKKRKSRLLILIGILTGLGFMTKGAMAFVPLIILFVERTSFVLRVDFWREENLSYNFFLTQIFRKVSNGSEKNQRRSALSLLLPIALIVVPWHLFMYFNFGNDFINQYFFYHYFERATSTIEQHYGWILFHFYNLFDLNFFSSGIALVAGLIFLIISKRLRKFKYFMIFSYSVLVLLIITLIQTKLAWYLLYLYPTGVIICGTFYNFIWKRLRKVLHHSKVLINK